MSNEVKIRVVIDGKEAAVTLKHLGDLAQQTGPKVHGMGGAFGTAGQQARSLNPFVTALNFTIRDSPYLAQNAAMGFMAISNNLGPLTDNFFAAKTQAGGFRGFIQQLTGVMRGPMGLSIALSVVVAAMQVFSFISQKAKKDASGLTDEAAKQAEELDKLEQKLRDHTATMEEAIEIDKRLREERIKSRLEDIKGEIEILELRSIAGGPSGGRGLNAEDAARLAALRSQEKDLQEQIKGGTALFKEHSKTLAEIGDAARKLSGQDLAAWLMQTNRTTQSIEAQIRTLEEHNKKLVPGTVLFNSNRTAAENLREALKLLQQTETDRAEEKFKSLKAEREAGEVSTNTYLAELTALKNSTRSLELKRQIQREINGLLLTERENIEDIDSKIREMVNDSMKEFLEKWQDISLANERLGLIEKKEKELEEVNVLIKGAQTMEELNIYLARRKVIQQEINDLLEKETKGYQDLSLESQAAFDVIQSSFQLTTQQMTQWFTNMFARSFNQVNSLFEMLVVNMVNTLVSKFMDSLVTDIFFKLFNIGTGSGILSLLGIGADGGVVTRPTLSLIGEAGPEAVVPLRNMPGAMSLNSLSQFRSFSPPPVVINKNIVQISGNMEIDLNKLRMELKQITDAIKKVS